MSDKGANRKLRAHKKSRRGCGNCKLRAVKVYMSLSEELDWTDGVPIVRRNETCMQEM